MIKHYCDVCSKEVNPQEDELMQITAVEKFYTKQMQKQYKQNQHLLCEGCSKKVMDYLNTLYSATQIEKKEEK